jgi:hypothetical protein
MGKEQPDYVQKAAKVFFFSATLDLSNHSQATAMSESQ